MSFLTSALGLNSNQPYDDYESQIKNLAKMFQPYMNIGMNNTNSINKEYNQMYNDPYAIMSQAMSHYHMSPYQQQMVNNTAGDVTRQMNNNQAVSGMLGSQSGMQALQNNLMKSEAGLNNQFSNQYLNRIFGLQSQGLQGQAGLSNMGLQALLQNIGLQKEGDLAGVKGSLAKQQSDSNLLSDVGGMLF